MPCECGCGALCPRCMETECDTICDKCLLETKQDKYKHLWRRIIKRITGR